MDDKSDRKPEELARTKIDKQLTNAGWEVVDRDHYVPGKTQAVKEAIAGSNLEADYILFIDGKATAVIEAKREDNKLGNKVAIQAEEYAHKPENWYKLWYNDKKLIPLVYLANGKEIKYKNMLFPNSEYTNIDISKMHSPKKMLNIIGKKSEYGALPPLSEEGLRACQYRAEINLEKSLKEGVNRSLAVLATGAGKTYLACLATYRLLNYANNINRVLFLVDRNNLSRQTESEFCRFNRTENGDTLDHIYEISRLKKNEDIKAKVVISTIQKLYAVLTGQKLREMTEEEEGEEDDLFWEEYDKNDTYSSTEKAIELGNDLKLPPDYFQFIVIDECHRSIYGKWKSVLDYFNGAKILGLTATPTKEAYAFFNNNIIEEYTYDDSVIDGVNVPSKVYRITTEKEINGGQIKKGSKVGVTVRGVEGDTTIIAGKDTYYSTKDKRVIDIDQMETILTEYRDSIYRDLYKDREENWEYIPKTLIFARSDKDADKIVDVCNTVFGEKFSDKNVPDKYVQKITYSAGDSNDLIRAFRNDRKFRIAVTVTLVATGTDVKPLEVVLFMNNIKSEVLYTQMIGRGCRTISEEKLREITPNSKGKNYYVIVDAVGVTESRKSLPNSVIPLDIKRNQPLDLLLEKLAHGCLNDEFLLLLRDYCAAIHYKYENDALFNYQLKYFESKYFILNKFARDINDAISSKSLPPFISVNDDNLKRANLISCLINNTDARDKLLELKKGYVAIIEEKTDTVIYSGFSKEDAEKFIESFEDYLNKNKDKIEALRIIYNSEKSHISHDLLDELRQKLYSEDCRYVAENIWQNYKTLDSDGSVDQYSIKENVKVLTDLIQIVRFAFNKSSRLISLYGNYSQMFTLYLGQKQRELTQEQEDIMRQIAEYIAREGYLSSNDLNKYNTDLWREGVKAFTIQIFSTEIDTLSNFILNEA